MVSAWRNFKNIFSRPLFTIIFRPEMLIFHPYSILTGDTMVGFVIFCVLSIIDVILGFGHSTPFNSLQIFTVTVYLQLCEQYCVLSVLMCCVIFYVKWHDLSREEQQKYYEKARSARQLHMEMYPHWNARDNYRFGLKKKKRKRDKSDDPGTNFSIFPFLISYSGMP